MMKIFVDLMSQPCRAVVLLLEVNRIPYTRVIVNLNKNEQKTNTELIKINPNKTVPTLCDDSISLYESGAILRYICGKYGLMDHWYPQNLQTRALVDQYLDWHHTKIRISSRWFFTQYMMGGSASDPVVIKSKALLIKSMQILNDYTLLNNRFIAGNSISIADLQAICELTQHWAVGRDVFSGFPNMERWAKDCIGLLQPSFDEVNKILSIVEKRQLFGVDTTPLKDPLVDSKL